MDKNWWHTLKNNKALKSFKKYLLNIINDLQEREIKVHMFKKEVNLDQILIEESSKEIDNYLKIKQKVNRKNILNSNKKIDGKRNINLLYMCLLKFNGLLRYMYFQGLNHDDINKMAHYIKHTFRKKGTYVFRQFDKSNALYGVIKGRAVIRLIETKDYTKKFSNEASNGGDIKSNPPERIHVDYFMSDCEIESDEEIKDNLIQNENEINDNQNKNNKNIIFDEEFNLSNNRHLNKIHFNSMRYNNYNVLSFKNEIKNKSH